MVECAIEIFRGALTKVNPTRFLGIFRFKDIEWEAKRYSSASFEKNINLIEWKIGIRFHRRHTFHVNLFLLKCYFNCDWLEQAKTIWIDFSTIHPSVQTFVRFPMKNVAGKALKRWKKSWKILKFPFLEQSSNLNRMKFVLLEKSLKFRWSLLDFPWASITRKTLYRKILTKYIDNKGSSK